MEVISKTLVDLFSNIGLTNPYILLVLVIWSLIWKAIALWRSSQNGQKVWFGTFVVLHTLGLVEIIYLIFFSKRKQKKSH